MNKETKIKINNIEKELLSIMKEDSTPDPGGEYWKNFNSRLAEKLEESSLSVSYITAIASFIIVVGLFVLFVEQSFINNNEYIVENRIAHIASNLSSDELLSAQELVFYSSYDDLTDDETIYRTVDNTLPYEVVEPWVEEDDIFNEIYNLDSNNLDSFRKAVRKELINLSNMNTKGV